MEYSKDSSKPPHNNRSVRPKPPNENFYISPSRASPIEYSGSFENHINFYQNPLLSRQNHIPPNYFSSGDGFNFPGFDNLNQDFPVFNNRRDFTGLQNLENQKENVEPELQSLENQRENVEPEKENVEPVSRSVFIVSTLNYNSFIYKINFILIFRMFLTKRNLLPNANLIMMGRLTVIGKIMKWKFYSNMLEIILMNITKVIKQNFLMKYLQMY